MRSRKFTPRSRIIAPIVKYPLSAMPGAAPGNFCLIKLKPAIRLLAILGVIVSTSLISHCGQKVIKGDESTQIKGYVLRESSNAPIDSAWITTRDTLGQRPRFYTDSTGYFQFTDFKGPKYYVYAGKAGYQTVKRWIDTATGPVTVEFRLKKL